MTSMPRPIQPCSTPRCPRPALKGGRCPQCKAENIRYRQSMRRDTANQSAYQSVAYIHARAYEHRRTGGRCVLCGSEVEWTCHHIDHDPHNNQHANIVGLCKHEHMRLEREHQTGNVDGPLHRALRAYLDVRV